MPEENNRQEEGGRQFVQRGRKPNWYSRIATVIASAGWLSAIVSLVVLDRAQPPGENLLTRIARQRGEIVAPITATWDTALLRVSLAALIISLVACGLGLLLSNLRMRRKSDRQNKLLISLLVVSVILFVVFLVFFSRYL